MSYDSVSGLNVSRGRSGYSPTLGRWVSLDPIRFEAGDHNLYRSVSNNPSSRLDPSGLNSYAACLEFCREVYDQHARVCDSARTACLERASHITNAKFRELAEMKCDVAYGNCIHKAKEELAACELRCKDNPTGVQKPVEVPAQVRVPNAVPDKPWITSDNVVDFSIGFGIGTAVGGAAIGIGYILTAPVSVPATAGAAVLLLLFTPGEASASEMSLPPNGSIVARIEGGNLYDANGNILGTYNLPYRQPGP